MDNNELEKKEILETKAYIFLEEGYFDKAHEFFFLAKLENPHSYKTCIGLILSSYKCKTEQELIENYPTVVFFDAAFVAESSCAKGEDAVRYSALKKSANAICLKNFIKYLKENDLFLVKKWAHHYSRTLGEDADEISTIIKDIADYDPADYKGKFVADILRLYNYCDKKSSAPVQASEFPVHTILRTDDIKTIYRTYLNNLKNGILCDFSADKIKLWIEPDAYYKNSYSEKVPIPCDIDGFPLKKEERHLAITELLWQNSDKTNLQFCNNIIQHYNDLLSYASNKAYVKLSMNKFFNKIIDKTKKTSSITQTLNFILEIAPDNAAANMVFVLRKTDDFKATNKPVKNDQQLEKFFQYSANEYTEDLVQQFIGNTNKLIEAENLFYNTYISALEPYVQNAINNTDDSEFKKKWTEYSLDIKKTYEANIETLNQRIAKINKKLKSDKSKQRAATKIKYVFAVFASLLFLLISALTVSLPAVLWSSDDFIDYNVFTVFAGMSGVIAVYTVTIQLILFALRKNLCSKKSLLAHKSKTTLRILSLCTLAVCLFSFGFTVIEGLTFNIRLGTVEISKVSQFSYIANNPGGNYILTSDIDLQEKSICLEKLSGSFDGNGYTIMNLNTQESTFISVNTGTVKNINFSNAILSNAIIETNKGIFIDSTFTGCTLYTPVINCNMNDVSKISFSDTAVTGDITATHLAFVVGTNTDAANVSHCTIDGGDITIGAEQGILSDFYVGTVVAYNNGTILNCHSTANINCKIIINGLLKQSDVSIGGIAGYSTTDNGSKAISYSSSTADINYNAKYILNDDACYFIYINIGGIVGSGCAEKTYFKGDINIDTNSDAQNNKIIYTNYYSVGALAGKGSLFEDCFARGNINVTASEKDDDSLCKFTVGSGIGQATGECITRCYNAVNCKINIDGEKYNYAHLLGDLQSVASADTSNVQEQIKIVKDSFVYGTSAAKNALGIPETDYEWANLYISSSLFPENENTVNNSDILSNDFISGKLNWDESVWIISESQFPELVQFVIPEDEAVSETDTETEITTEQ